jgi:Mrp family chromosome partitioning ATPase
VNPRALRGIFRALLAGADAVIVDAPLQGTRLNARTLAPHVRGVVLVAAAGVTRRYRLVEASNRIRRASGSLLGVVLNATPSRHHQDRDALDDTMEHAAAADL